MSSVYSASWWNSNYTYRDTINVKTGGNDPYNGYTNYTVQLIYNTTGSKYLDSGDDVRIVYWDGTTNRELNRELLNPNSTNSKIRFALQENIASSNTVSNYYLYYDNPSASAPPTNYSNVYIWYDNASTDRESEYTQGRVDNSAHGGTWGDTLNWNSNGYYTYDTGDNFVDSFRPTGITERDIYIEYEEYQTNTYSIDMTSGPMVRWIGSGAPGSETATDMYYYEMGESLIQGGSYSTHDDVTIDERNGNIALADGTLGFFPTATWVRLGLSAWGNNPDVNLKTYYQNESGGWEGFRKSGTHGGGQRNKDPGQFGFWLQQDAGRVDNILARRYIEPEPSLVTYNSTKYNSNITISFINKNPTSTSFLLKNTTEQFSINISCSESFLNTCGTIDSFTRYNTTSGFSNISTVPGTAPLWTPSTRPQTCTSLNGGSSCSVSWDINASGTPGTQHLINFKSISNRSEVLSSISQNLTLKIINSNLVAFNQSLYDFTTFEKDSGNKNTSLLVESIRGNNSNINITCDSGDCSVFNNNWTNGISLNQGENQTVEFSCSDETTGTFSATYSVTSNEQPDNSTLSLQCGVTKIFGPIAGNITSPNPATISKVGQNTTFTLEATINCTGECGTITSYPILERPKTGFSNTDPADSSWQLKQDYPFFDSGLYWIQSPAMGSPQQFYIDMEYNSGGWTMVGRGKEGWNWDDAGQGTASEIIGNITGPDAFTPAYYSSSFIDNIANITAPSSFDKGVRLRRANTTDGSEWQNVIWNFSTLSTWDWNFDSGFSLSDYIVNGVNYGSDDTNDANPFDDYRRTYTFADGDHNNQRGFSYGNGVCAGANTNDNYLWEYISECKSIPFTQVYIQPKVATKTPGIIPDASGTTPFYTLSNQSQTCDPIEDGLCTFTWTINATGPIDSLHNISVLSFSNISSIARNRTENTIINISDNVVPEVTLLKPNNQSKLLDEEVEFIWEVTDDDSTLDCTLYLNSIENQSTSCSNTGNTSLSFNISPGSYNWNIEATDSINNSKNSSTKEFLAIRDYSGSVTKKISSISTDMYFIDIITNNSIRYPRKIITLDFVQNNFNYGSFSLFYDFIISIIGEHTGDILGWNKTLSQNSSLNINYSVTKNNQISSISDLYIVGLD